jgi:isopenicillin N synthase-like dioxygenase
MAPRDDLAVPQAAAIPRVDLSGWRGDAVADRRAIADVLGAAAEGSGFMTVVGHGIPAASIAAVLAAGARFFALPEGVKLAMRDANRSDRGYQPMFDNVADDGKPSALEGFTMSHPVAPTDPALAELSFYQTTPWPDDVPGFRAAFERLYDELFAVGIELLDALALHLDVDPEPLHASLVDTYSHMRINPYPQQETVAHIADEGVFAHHDESLLTLLVQDGNSGLEVLSDDGWIAVEPDPNAIVVNVGKMLAYWTGGRYHAALHRVVNRSGRDRYSIPLFVHPSYRTHVDPGVLLGSPSADYPPIVAGETVAASFAKSRKSWQEADAPD